MKVKLFSAVHSGIERGWIDTGSKDRRNTIIIIIYNAGGYCCS